MIRKFGYHPDLPDDRDHDAYSVLLGGPLTAPSYSRNRHMMPAVVDQGRLSSCVGNAVSTALSVADARSGVAVVGNRPSRLWLYKVARNVHGAGDVDGGTHIRACLEAARAVGYPLETVWPYDESAVNRSPSWAATRQASKHLEPTRYLRIMAAGSARLDAVKRALAQGYLVVFGAAVDEAFMGLGPAHAAIGPFIGPVVGGHALAIVEHDDDVFTCANSWGEGWGEGGYFRATADMVVESARDLWIVDKGAKR